jgi:CBS domain-containing protein
MASADTRSSGRRDDTTRENGRYVRPDDRDRYSTERVGYATGPEGFDVEPGWRSRPSEPEGSQLDVPYRRYPPSGPGASPELGPQGGASSERGRWSDRGASQDRRETYGRGGMYERERDGSLDHARAPSIRSEAGRSTGGWYREPLTVVELMTRDVKAVTGDTSLADVAALMRDEDVGSVPIVDETRSLEGIVTDRDMVVRGIAKEKSTPPRELYARDVATKDVEAASSRDSISQVLELMGRKQIRRVPVVDENRRLVGMISLGDIASRADYDQELQEALQQISGRRSFWSRIWR